jgi:hypothetical protein
MRLGAIFRSLPKSFVSAVVFSRVAMASSGGLSLAIGPGAALAGRAAAVLDLWLARVARLALAGRAPAVDLLLSLLDHA